MRKHHNKLYYGKYRYKTVFKMPGSIIFYPTTNEHLINIKKRHPNNPDIIYMADFIMQNRNKMKFRFQDKTSIFYSDKKIAQQLVEHYWEYWVGSETVDPKFTKLDKNTVGCTRLPHGKFEYQIYLKKDAQRYINDYQKKNLFSFIDRNADNCLVPGYALRDYLEDKCQYCFGGYFYVTKQQFITPIYMMAQEAIDKVIKFRKVENGSHKKIKR
tara:strand:+ start:2330 stop:2971 length:642 start_codon:yes stop_codon:yes gene_type:complete